MSVQTEASPVGGATTHVRAELARVDTKASTLLALSGTALTVLLALLARTRLPGLAVAAGWLTAGLIATAVLLLALAIRPNLTGGHGLVRYARRDPAELCEEFHSIEQGDGQSRTDHERREAAALVALSRLAVAKYRRVRAAVDLLLAGLAGIALTAALAALL
ncbi:Pycsar system effector family protein [Actinoplanes sp. NPDC051861]|uniref:Pycsar system effector family protein n=1 Tax=Actinoplanes sp. NPDC051861 TaxID=3155170 RepID=UPI003425496D